MQLKQLSPIAGIMLTALLGACGGKGDDAPPPAPPPPPPPVVAAPAAISSTPLLIMNTPLQFTGGECSGGTPPFAPASWDFGDGTPASASGTHTYAAADTYFVKVTCKDSKDVSATSSPLAVKVYGEAYAGFLGRTWSNYAAIDPVNKFLYPVAGITTSGDVYSVWLRSNTDKITNQFSTTDVAAGSTQFSATNWTPAADLQVGAAGNYALFNGTDFLTSSASMDMAVSPGGKALAAWKAGSKLWYSTKDGAGDWSTPASVSGIGSEASEVPVLDLSIKVVVNDAGNGAIAYCTGATPTASVVTYSSASKGIASAPQVISQKCDNPINFFSGVSQRSRTFDIAIDGASKVSAVGLSNAPTSGNFYVSLMTHTGAWSSPTNLSDELTTSGPVAPTMPSTFSLSYSLSPDGTVAGVAWTQMDTQSPLLYPTPAQKTIVMASIYAGGTWTPVPDPVTGGKGQKVEPTTIYDFNLPLIAVNDAGQAFLAMERAPTTNSRSWTLVSNYDPTTKKWRASVAADGDLATSGDFKFNATDIAIDKWGTGLLARVGELARTQAAMLSKEGIWSGFTTISPAYTNFHFQTLRALPDGRAILVTSTGGQGTSQIASGYLMLK